MSNSTKSITITCGFTLLFFLPRLPAQEAVLAPVPVIRSQGELEEETGAGVLVGHKNGLLYFLTAAHVISDPNSIGVQLYKGATLAGKLEKSNQPLDIAVVSCPAPASFVPPASFALAKAGEKALQAVIVAGHPLGNYWDINFNSNVKSMEFDLDDRLFTLAPIGVAPGNSGGPVLTQQYELLGLIVRVDQVNAVCVDAGALLKACQSWEIPTNLLTGITVEKTAPSGQEDFRYQLFVQEANTAYAARKWAQAKTAFEHADALAPSEDFKKKISECTVEIARDEGYRTKMEQGRKAADLKTALGLFEQARQNRDTEEVRALIQTTKEKLAKLDIAVARPAAASDKLPEKITDEGSGDILMILVRGGTFTMGCDTCTPEQYPAHQVYLDDYYIGAYEVTVGQYCEFLNDVYADYTNISPHYFNQMQIEQKGIRSVFKPKPGLENYPVLNRPRQEIYIYCQWLYEKTGQTYRLPTEAEWEYAAKGRGNNHYSPDPGIETYYTREPQASGSTGPNELGLFDLTGNVPELCSDWYSDSYYAQCKAQGVVANPAGPPAGMYKSARHSYDTFRKPHHTWGSSHGCGFRLVRLPYSSTPRAQLAGIFEQNMVAVKGGRFMMGSDKGRSDNQPVHPVVLDDFYISAIEVTNEQWWLVMDTVITEGDEGRAAVNINWYQAQQFITALNTATGMNYRLPTEAEWEYAARGGSLGADATIFAGSNQHMGIDVAWSVGNKPSSEYRYESMYAAQLKPNALRLYDMSGNVSEWCQDWYGDKYYRNSPSKNPQGPPGGTFKVCRGGSTGDWAWEDRQCYQLVYIRDAQLPDNNERRCGLRLVRSAK